MSFEDAVIEYAEMSGKTVDSVLQFEFYEIVECWKSVK